MDVNKLTQYGRTSRQRNGRGIGSGIAGEFGSIIFPRNNGLCGIDIIAKLASKW
jgi:hypothetical protein